MAIKSAYSTKELFGLLNVSASSSIVRRASRENWQSRPRAGRGGGREWLVDSMPEATRLAIRTAEEKAALDECKTSAAVPFLPSATVTAIMDDGRRYKALAKADLVRQYLAWQRKFGATTTQKDAFITAYKGGAWPQLFADLGDVSWKTIERWKLEQERAGSVLALADKRGVAHRGRSLLSERHRVVILGHILNPNAPAVSQCVREVQKKFMAEGLFIPSEPTIRRFIRNYTAECYDEWTLFREGKKAWNDKCAISLLRDWNLVGVGDVVIADGHTLNFETLNPETGKATRMTLLLFYDGASNCPLGWEIMPTENTACIASAFRRTCLMLGKFPRVVYLDNGKAFRAKYFKGCPDFEQAGILGLYKDLGCEVIHAWPYHGQSKPVERFFGTMHDLEVWMPSYTGYDIAHKPARMKRGEDLHRQLYDKLGGRPLSLEETHTQVARWFAEYAMRPQHRTHLHGRTPGEVFMEGRGEGLSPADEQRLVLLMMQKEIRVISKDGFKLNGRLFWHESLASRRHAILVRYDDQLSPHEAHVFTLDGQFLCTALDREHHRIACGLHPAARILGTEEQKAELQAALSLKKSQERSSSATMRGLLKSIVLPETQARMAALEAETPKRLTAPTAPSDRSRLGSMRAGMNPSTPSPLTPGAARGATPSDKVLSLPKVTAEEEAALEEAKRQARAAMDASPRYTPSGLKRWKDSAERYAYLFGVKYEQGLELVTDDAAWMEVYEASPEFERYHKNRYASLRELFERKARAI